MSVSSTTKFHIEYLMHLKPLGEKKRKIIIICQEKRKLDSDFLKNPL